MCTNVFAHADNGGYRLLDVFLHHSASDFIYLLKFYFLMCPCVWYVYMNVGVHVSLYSYECEGTVLGRFLSA